MTKNIDPVGKLNDHYIRKAVKDSDKVVLAWEADGGLKKRDKEVLGILKGVPTYCFKKTLKGKPEIPS